MNKKKLEYIFSQVKKIRLNNGFEILYYEDPDFSNYYMEFTTKYGALDFTYLKDDRKIEHNKGIAHFLEHVMFNMPYGDAMSRFNENLGSSNAYTSYDKTVYLVKCSENPQANLETLLDLVNSIHIDDDKVNKEKGIIVEEIGIYDNDPESEIFKLCLESGFRNIKYKYDILGKANDVENMTKEMLIEAYEDFYTPNNQHIVIVGPSVLDLVCYVKEYMSKKKNSEYGIKKIKELEEFVEFADLEYKKNSSIDQEYIGKIDKYIFKESKDSFKNELNLEMFLELLYTSFNAEYIKAYENKEIDYTFDYDFIVHSNVILIIFFGINQNVQSLNEFIERNNVEIVKSHNMRSLINQKLGALVRSFDNEVDLSRLLNKLQNKNVTLNDYYKYLDNFNVEDFQCNFKEFKKNKIFCKLSK